ncbi:hypothetical protein BGX38DRAFT_1158471 [Terfezia claveryi]|nr:hypothetical protein BGX38DRAFT_1158471 [Terfezia claveryi]
MQVYLLNTYMSSHRAGNLREAFDPNISAYSSFNGRGYVTGTDVVLARHSGQPSAKFFNATAFLVRKTKAYQLQISQ